MCWFYDGSTSQQMTAGMGYRPSASSEWMLDSLPVLTSGAAGMSWRTFHILTKLLPAPDLK